MKRLGLVAAVIVAVIAIVIAMRHRGGEPAAPAASTSPAGATRSAATRALPRASIRGGVADPAGTPIAGARVCADPTIVFGLDPACATTGADGSYAIEVLATTYEIAAAAPKFHVAAYREPIRLHAGEARAHVDLVLKPGGVEVTGTVADITGGPIARAVVRPATETQDINIPGGWGPPVVADEHGAFSLWVAPGEIRLHASASGYAPTDVDATAPDRVAIVLTPESSIDGTVVDATGQPVADADVSANAVDVHEHATSDERGHFHIEHLAPARYDIIAHTATGYGRSAGSVLVALAAHVDNVVITLHAAYRVTGRVLLAGKPCARPGVELHDVAHDREIQLVADDDGWLHGDGIQTGTYVVHPKCTGGYTRDRLQLVIDRDQVGLTWSLVTGATLRGHVRAKTGAPIEGATVNASADDKSAFVETTTTADGAYELSGLPAMTYAVTASTERGTKRVTHTIAASETATLELVLDDGGLIKGTVTDRAGKPVPHVWVAADGDVGAGHGTSLLDGSFTIELDQPGAFDVIASADPFHPLDGPHVKEHVLLESGDVADVQLVVDPRTAKITGTVTDADNAPVADAYVAAYPAGDFGTFFWSFTDHHPTLTDQSGHFEITELATASTYTVHAYRKGGGETLASGVAPGSTVHLVLARTGSIAGTVRYSDGGVPDIVDVQARDQPHAVFRDELFDHTNGTFTLDDLPAGTYVVSAATPDGIGVVDVTLAASQRATGLAIVLDRYLPVTGRVVDKHGAPLAGVSALVASTHTVRGSVVTPDDPNISDASGRFTTLAPRGEDRISFTTGLRSSLCGPVLVKTIEAPLELGDVTLSPCN
jgi:protocatechuate 3,4-dioxygenase beta subunit